MIAWGDIPQERFASRASDLRDRMSQFAIFPTLLVLMGYDEVEVN